MKNKKIICILLCVILIFLYACSDEPEDEQLPESDIAGGYTGIIDEEINTGINIEEDEDIADEAEPEEFNINELALGYFVIETPDGEEPVHNDDGTMTLPGGGIISSAENDSKFELGNGAVLNFDGHSPYRIYIDSPFKLLGNNMDIVIESPDGFSITIDGLEEQLRESAGGAGREPRIAPWDIIFDGERNAVFEFKVNGIKFISLDSVFPMYKDEHNGVILFKKCRIELADGTVIDAPLNTKAQIDTGEFKIIIGEGSATVTRPDGTAGMIPGGTVFDGGFEVGI